MAVSAEHEDDLVDRVVDVVIEVVFAHMADFVLELLAEQRRAFETALGATAEQREALETELRAQFAGQTIRVGKGTASRRRRRNEAILRDHADGLSLDELAQKYPLSRGHIARILRGGK